MAERKVSLKQLGNKKDILVKKIETATTELESVQALIDVEVADLQAELAKYTVATPVVESPAPATLTGDFL